MRYLEHREMTPAEIRLEWELHAPQSATAYDIGALQAMMEAEMWYGTSDPWAVGWRMWWATQRSRR